MGLLVFVGQCESFNIYIVISCESQKEPSNQGLQYTVCHSIRTFCTDYSMVKPHYSILRIIKAMFSGFQSFLIFTVNT